jgi:hypothetical protein
MKHRALTLLFVLIQTACLAGTLEQDFANPPRDARLRAYWWWINGNVTREAITRDLEQMKAKGFGGALICDADGSSQEGNDRAPHGPTFFSPEWRELYKHTLREADRLGLEMSLNIQSGWNLGGPMVKAEDAPKKLVWTETRVTGGAAFTGALPQPKGRDGLYRDLFVLAYRETNPGRVQLPIVTLSASTSQAAHPPTLAADGEAESFWVSDGSKPGEGPTAAKPQWLAAEFANPVTVTKVTFAGRPGYGPRECELRVSEDGKTFRTVKKLVASISGDTTVTLDPVEARAVRLVAKSAYDPRFPDTPRNVQLAELRISGPAFIWPDPSAAGRRPLQNQMQKALLKPLVPFSAPDSAPLFQEFAAKAGEEDTIPAAVVDLTAKLGPDGKLDWTAPEGLWTVLRFGYTLNDHCRVSTCSEGWEGYALDPFDDGAFRRYWDAVVEPLIADAGPLAGTALKYLHTDSWEVEVANWTPTLREQFLKRRGYDLLPWLPVIAGKIVEGRTESNRFLHDFRRTMGDLAIANHYQLFRDEAHKHGLLIHPESGGPHAVPIDAQQCLGFNDAPMSEFWAWSWRHRMGDENRFFVKQPASAAHTCGRKLVLAEGFTTIGPHWQETLWDNLKPSFDKALCEGLNLLVWHAFVCSPKEQGIPGLQYFAGTHLNPNVTWWDYSVPFFGYINRCQALLQRGRPFADVLYYYGDSVPNFTQHKRTDPAKVQPGYDYDVISEEALLARVSIRDGRLVLPDGVSYRMLVLANREVISLPVLRKVSEWVAAGATVIGPKPAQASGLLNSEAADAEVRHLADALWLPVGTDRRAVHKGIVSDRTAREVLLAQGVLPDCEIDVPTNAAAAFDFIHRTDGEAEIYFVANRSTNAVAARCTFRVAGKAPELWDAVSGTRAPAKVFEQKDGRVTVPLDFAPCGSQFVVFREKGSGVGVQSSGKNAMDLSQASVLNGPWEVTFDPKWGGPEKPVIFTDLSDWTEQANPGIKHYSGTAVYRKGITLPEPRTLNPVSALFLDLGLVRELAEVRVNGKACGIVWTPPFRVDITEAVKPGANEVEIRVVNFWYNRVAGDKDLPVEKRLTRTNIKKLSNPGTPLMPSGLMGPVQVLKGTARLLQESPPPPSGSGAPRP